MAAGTRRNLVSVPAGGVVENVLEGSPLAYPGVPSSIDVFAAVIAAGAGDVTMDVMIGTEMVAEGLLIGIEYALGEGPRIPEHQVMKDAVGPADHVQVRLRNSGAGARDVTYHIVIQPV